MPVTLSYPGVYVTEVPSGVRTITGVPTSIAAFVGRALRGPANEPTIVNGFADFETKFGGLWTGSSLGFAVRDFFLNGGGQAVIVRVVGGSGAPATFAVGDVSLVAASAGGWGNALEAKVEKLTVSDTVGNALAASIQPGLTKADLFNLTITDKGTGKVEKYANVTLKESPRRYDRILGSQSQLALATVAPAANAAITEGTSAAPVSGADGNALTANDFTADQANKKGLYALEKADLFNLLCIPPYLNLATDGGDVDASVLSAATAYCEAKRAILIVDPPTAWTTPAQAVAGVTTFPPERSKNAAVYFPRLREANPLHAGALETFAPCGAVAGVIARTDTQRGVWKAPAGTEAALVGVPALSIPMTDPENGSLNVQGVNCLRTRPEGRVVWGARTAKGADLFSDEYKYLPVRRTALYIEESLFRGLQWVVFEPNDEPLWAQIRLNAGAFMHNLFRQGAFQGSSPRDAYFVKCDKETTTQTDIDLGIVNVVVGFAPLKPAEFVVLKLQQIAGQIEF